jgi:hypothetical protein
MIFFDKKLDWIIGKIVNWMEVLIKTNEHNIARIKSLLKYQQAKKTGRKNKSWVSVDNLIAFLEKEYLSLLAAKKRIILCVIHPEKTAVRISIALIQIEKFPYPLAPNKCLKTGIESPEISAGKIILMR